MTPAELDAVRFWARVDQGPGCWEWMGPRTPRGYGLFTAGSRTTGRRSVLTHRFALELTGGEPLPAGLVVDHLCRNPSCCRPDHLELVVQATNVRRGRLARLSAEKAAAIRAAHAAGATTYALAEAYGVSQPTVSRICSGRLWAPVTEESTP